MTEVVIDIGEDTSGNLEVTLRGTPEAVANLLVKGLPLESLEKIRDAFQAVINETEFKESV